MLRPNERRESLEPDESVDRHCLRVKGRASECTLSSQMLSLAPFKAKVSCSLSASSSGVAARELKEGESTFILGVVYEPRAFRSRRQLQTTTTSLHRPRTREQSWTTSSTTTTPIEASRLCASALHLALPRSRPSTHEGRTASTLPPSTPRRSSSERDQPSALFHTPPRSHRYQRPDKPASYS